MSQLVVTLRPAVPSVFPRTTDVLLPLPRWPSHFANRCRVQHLIISSFLRNYPSSFTEIEVICILYKFHYFGLLAVASVLRISNLTFPLSRSPFPPLPPNPVSAQACFFFENRRKGEKGKTEEGANKFHISLITMR